MKQRIIFYFCFFCLLFIVFSFSQNRKKRVRYTYVGKPTVYPAKIIKLIGKSPKKIDFLDSFDEVDYYIENGVSTDDGFFLTLLRNPEISRYEIRITYYCENESQLSMMFNNEKVKDILFPAGSKQRGREIEWQDIYVQIDIPQIRDENPISNSKEEKTSDGEGTQEIVANDVNLQSDDLKLKFIYDRSSFGLVKINSIELTSMRIL